MNKIITLITILLLSVNVNAQRITTRAYIPGYTATCVITEHGGYVTVTKNISWSDTVSAVTIKNIKAKVEAQKYFKSVTVKAAKKAIKHNKTFNIGDATCFIYEGDEILFDGIPKNDSETVNDMEVICKGDTIIYNPNLKAKTVSFKYVVKTNALKGYTYKLENNKIAWIKKS